MKKILLKILGTILAIVVFCNAQHYIRQYYGIDPRIWFFVVYGISIVGLIIILMIFHSEIKNMEEYFKTHSFFDFLSETIEKISGIIKPIAKRLSTKVKLINEKVVNNFIYNLLTTIITIVVVTGIMYKFFFYDDFMARTTLNIVFLVMIALVVLSAIIEATVIEKEKRTREVIYCGIWILGFLINFVEFVCK